MTAHDKAQITELVQDWAVYRDAGLWERFAQVWHDDGWMNATWFHGPYREFIEANRRGWEAGVHILHFLGGTALEVRTARAIAQTKMTISQRAPVEGVLCDVVCTGRFYDFFERRQDRWGLVTRQPIYERDRIDPVNPVESLTLDQARLESYPEGYKHLAYLQSGIGYTITHDMPQLSGAIVESLYASGATWLAGGDGPARSGTDG